MTVSLVLRGGQSPAGARNGLPPPGGYAYRGRKRDLGVDLAAANRKIMAARDGAPLSRGPGFPGDGRTCRNGHRRTPATTRLRPDGTRKCLLCDRAAKVKYRRTKGRTS